MFVIGSQFQLIKHELLLRLCSLELQTKYLWVLDCSSDKTTEGLTFNTDKSRLVLKNPES